MTISKLKTIIIATGILTGFFSFAFAGIALAVPAASTGSQETSSSSQTAVQQQHLANIKSRGAAEINRRLDSLNNAVSKINSAAHLSASDKATLNDEVNSEIVGLTTLQTKLAADTTVADASTDAKSIVTDYRVYALVLPKIWFVKTADDQQTTESKLTTLAQKLQVRINTAKSSGKDVTTLQIDLEVMTTQTTNAQNISSSIEQKVIALQPSDYNSDHTILSGDANQLKTAHKGNQTALADANNIIAGLKNL